jgi:hypothetical protein
MQDLSELRIKISTYTSAITLHLNLTCLGSQGRVERQINSSLPEIQQSINWITAKLSTIGDGTSLTSYIGDDKSFWRELRRELVTEGCSSSQIKQHRQMIVDYIKELGERGALDEPQPVAPAPPTSDSPIGRRSPISTTPEALRMAQYLKRVRIHAQRQQDELRKRSALDKPQPVAFVPPTSDPSIGHHGPVLTTAGALKMQRKRERNRIFRDHPSYPYQNHAANMNNSSSSIGNVPITDYARKGLAALGIEDLEPDVPTTATSVLRSSSNKDYDLSPRKTAHSSQNRHLGRDREFTDSDNKSSQSESDFDPEMLSESPVVLEKKSDVGLAGNAIDSRSVIIDTEGISVLQPGTQGTDLDGISFWATPIAKAPRLEERKVNLPQGRPVVKSFLKIGWGGAAGRAVTKAAEDIEQRQQEELEARRQEERNARRAARRVQRAEDEAAIKAAVDRAPRQQEELEAREQEETEARRATKPKAVAHWLPPKLPPIGSSIYRTRGNLA